MATQLATPLPFPSDPSHLTNTDSNDEVYEYLRDGRIVEYDLNRLVFTETVAEKIPAAPGTEGPPMINYRIGIQDRRADGKLQDLLIRTEDLFTFGVSESHDQKTGELNGYSLPIPMWNQEGATASQKYFTDLLEVLILNKIKDHLVAVRKTFKQPDLETRDLRKMKVFYRKKDDEGSVNPDDPPTWYPKLIVNKRKGLKIVSRFYLMDSVDANGNPIELVPLKLKEKMGRTMAVVKLDSIYVRAEGASLQCKLWEADYKPVEAALPRKGRVSQAAQVVNVSDNNPLSALMKASSSSQEEEKSQSPTGTKDSETAEVTAGGDITVTDVLAAASVTPTPPAPTNPSSSRVVRTVKVTPPAKKP